MNKLLTQRKPLIVAAALACVAVLVAGWFLLVSPQRAAVAEVRQQVAEQESSNNSLRAQIAQLQALTAQLPAQRAALARISAKVPVTPDLPALVRLLNDAAQSSNVTLQGISPAAPAALSGTDGLSSIDVALKVSGDYVSIEQYHLALEGLSRAFLVQGLTIAEATGANSASGTGPTALTATINGRVLVGSPSASSGNSGGVSTG